jgi:hypothetical protein
MKEFFSCDHLRILVRDSVFDGKKQVSYYCFSDPRGPVSCRSKILTGRCDGIEEVI